MPKISGLPTTTTPTGADILPIVQSGTTKQTTFAKLPISDAVTTALALKADANNTTLTGTTTINGTLTGAGVTKAAVGLGNVDNTSDVNKPVSTAQQTALNGVVVSRNKIINGNFTINQRVVSGTVTLAAGAYGHDRWKAGASGCTYTFSTTNGVTTLSISAGSLQQVIEGLNLLSGTHVMSWTGTAQGKIGAGAFSASGVTSSVTGGANLTVEFGTGTLSLVQLEPGSQATTFENRLIATEMVLCQRYYEVIEVVHATTPSSTQNMTMTWRVEKRTSPSITATQSSGSGMPTFATTGGGKAIFQNSAPGALGTASIALNAEL